MNRPKAPTGDLAILGSPPAFATRLYVNRPNVGDRAVLHARMEEMLDRRWFTNGGPLVEELEGRLARYLGVRHCVLVCNGTMALELAFRALDLTGEVIVPSLTFVATAHALLWQGIEPVFCDIDPETWNLDPVACEALVTPRTTAIVGVHLWGRPCDTSGLAAVAERYGLRLLFDAAHAFGCTHEGKMIGGFGDAEVFSFHATKVFHTTEGGAVTTDDDDLAARLRLLRNFGFTDYDTVKALGTNAKMPEMSAAMGLTNLEHLDRFFAQNQRTYETYRQELEEAPGLRLLPYDARESHNRHYMVLEVDEAESGLARDHLLRILHAENVLARRYFYPGCHRSEPYVSRSPEVDRRLPYTNRATDRVLVLPGGAGVTSRQVRKVCSILRFAVSHAEPVRCALESEDFRARLYSLPTAARDSTRIRARTRPRVPKLEIRIPISPNEKDLRMVRYLLESIREFGGPIGRAAHCVVSVGADERPRDLAREHPWAADHSIAFEWVDRDLFRRRSYDGTGLHRLWIESDADVVALVDADLLIAGDFDRLVLKAHREQRLLGFIAHVSPFDGPELRHVPSDRWWNWIFEEAGLPRPRLDWEHTGWGLMSEDPRHRYCPAYFNYGVIIAPREFVERMGETFEDELDAVDRVVDSWAKSQIANTLAFTRHDIPCGTFSINYNFPLHVPEKAIRALNPDPDGEDGNEDIKIFHYLGEGEINRRHFATRESLQEVMDRTEMSPAGRIFQRKLRAVGRRIAESETDSIGRDLSKVPMGRIRS